ncbi:alpha/beta fold hydrolase [Gulosibacter molinativorax]|uniref:Alpha/beta hydrolase n=1 Tax=Gulosibacter molinativorax TaxID=256821 RepID=A0ABT7CAN7_9MICO|nr:alpha/beta hydrolase [Gulosibacter molinativorax]MDJ1372260.1 alpha/beta hydrolase [Gulosibacter molinativorax]QUY63455.1 Hypotetical protein [Gulosibacter molinativorax]
MTLTEETNQARTWKYYTEPTIVDVDGVATAYRRGGTGEPLVYLHGGGGTREWAPIHQQLAEQFDVIAPEHPGFGDTPRPHGVDSWEDFVLHYDAFFRALGLEKFHLVGTSMGAWLAANLAITFPERYNSLTLITPLGTRIQDEPFIDIFRGTAEDEAKAFFNGRQDRYAEDLVQEGELEDFIFDYGQKATAALLMFNPRYDFKLDRKLKRVQIPALVIGVDDDRVVGNQQAGRFAELLPNAILKTISGTEGEPSGHGVTVEQPADVTQAIRDFTASL